MSRKTYSLSALAVAATASLSFSSADNAEAYAQASADEIADVAAPEQSADHMVEIIPQQSEFVSSEVIQPLPDTPAAPAIEGAASLRELVGLMGDTGELSEQMRCLASAVYFEARGEALSGQLAVAEVVINRSEDARWPSSYCGVVYQPSQFSFVRGGRMPQIRTGSVAWTRAKAIARIAHNGLWQSEAEGAVYFHASYVRPGWSRSKTRLARIDTHVFYR